MSILGLCLVAAAQLDEASMGGGGVQAQLAPTGDVVVTAAFQPDVNLVMGLEGEAPDLVAGDSSSFYVSGRFEQLWLPLPHGLEHVIVTYEPGAIAIATGDLVAVVIDDETVQLVDGDGLPRFQYSGLFVFDDALTPQPARFALREDGALIVEIDATADALWPLVVDPVLTPTAVIDGAAAGDSFGQGVAVGDLNNDGRLDLAVGAPGIGATNRGRVRCYLQSSAGVLPATPSFTVDPITSSPNPLRANDDDCGDSVRIGDVDGNGSDDLVYSCSRFGPNGAIFVHTQVTTSGFPFTSGIDAATPTWILRDANLTAHAQRGQMALFNTQGTSKKEIITIAEGRLSIWDLSNGTSVAPDVSFATGIASNDPQIAVVEGLSNGAPAIAVAGQSEIRFFRVPSGGAPSLANQATALPLTGSSQLTSVSAGDFDGDHDSDLLVGRRNNTAAGAINGGQAFAFENDDTDETFDLRQTFNGVSGDRRGSAVLAADLNHDGRADAIICAHGTGSNRGQCTVTGGVPPNSTLLDMQTRALFNGSAADANLGLSEELAFGNFSNAATDTAADVVVGEFFANGQVGAVQIAVGEPANLEAVPSLLLQSNQVNGVMGFRSSAIAVGRINDDGFDDVIIGGRSASGRGVVFGWFGGASMDATVDFCLSAPAGGGFGTAVAIARIGGASSPARIAVGSPDFNPTGATSDADTGRVSVFTGPFAGCNVTATTIPSYTLASPVVGARFGQALANTLDLWNSAFDGLAIGAPAKDTTTVSFVTLLPSDGSVVSMDVAAGFLEGSFDCKSVGSHLAVGRIEGSDARNDVLVGADQCDNGAGKAFIIRSVSSSPFIPLVTTWRFSAGAGSKTGPVAAGKDVNGDGVADFLVGSPGFSSLAGRAQLFYGSATATLPSTTPSLLLGGGSTSLAGTAMALGDVNRDGFADFVIGEPFYDETATPDEGRARAYFGGSAPTTATKRTYESDCTSCEIGTAIASGDLNGDGYADMVIVAPDESLGENFEGVGHVVFGRW